MHGVVKVSYTHKLYTVSDAIKFFGKKIYQ